MGEEEEDLGLDEGVAEGVVGEVVDGTDVAIGTGDRSRGDKK